MKTNNRSNIFTHPIVMSVLATICCLLWGSAFPAIKLGYRWFDIAAEATGTQILFAGCRFTLAGILTLIIGSILGFSGIVLVNLTGAGLDFSFQMQGEGMIILSTVCYGISSALIRVYGKDENPVVLTINKQEFSHPLQVVI